MKHDEDLDIPEGTKVANPLMLTVELCSDVSDDFVVVTLSLFSGGYMYGQRRYIRVASFGGVLSHHHFLGRHFDIPLLLRIVFEVVLG